jgi:hypothetical protein
MSNESGVAFPPISSPQKFFGNTFSWPEGVVHGPSYVREIKLLNGDFAHIAEYRFVFTKETLRDGLPVPTAYVGGHSSQFHIRIQHGNIVTLLVLHPYVDGLYMPEDCEEGGNAAKRIKDTTTNSAGAPPDWKTSGATWPTDDQKPMVFLAQFRISRESSAYVFQSRRNQNCIKVFVQYRSDQTAEEHYDDELNRR